MLNPHNPEVKVTSSILNLEVMKNKLREIKGLTQIIILQFDVISDKWWSQSRLFLTISYTQILTDSLFSITYKSICKLLSLLLIFFLYGMTNLPQDSMIEKR